MSDLLENNYWNLSVVAGNVVDTLGLCHKSTKLLVLLQGDVSL